MASNEKRGGSLEVKGPKMYNGQTTFSEKDSSNEQAIRGGEGTSKMAEGSTAGGAFSPEAAANGYPSNK
jgi:hypothetical protein